MALHQLKGGLGRKPPLVGHDAAAEIERGQQGVHQAAGPGPVGRAPEHLVVVGAKPVLAADEAGQVADQRAVRNQGAFGRPGGATGVDQHGRVLGQGVARRETLLSASQHRRPVQIALPLRRAHSHHRAQAGAIRAHSQEIADGALVHQRRHRTTVLQAVDQGIGAEQHGQRHRHRAHLVQRHVGNGRLGALRHHHRHAVASRDTGPLQGMAELVGLGLQCGVAELAAGATFVLPGHRRARAPTRVLRPAGAAHLGDVEVFGHTPDKATVQLGVRVLG